jgi:hypothetical protein
LRKPLRRASGRPSTCRQPPRRPLPWSRSKRPLVWE